MFHPVLTPAEFQKSLHPIVRVDAVAKIFRNKVLPTDLSGKQVLHYSIPNVQEIGTGKIEDGDTIDSDKWLITEEAVLISKLNPRKSTICLAAPQGGITVASTEFVVLSTGNSIDNRYIKYILESEIVRQFLTSRSTSATRSHQRVNPHDIIALGIPWPEESTRTKIVKELNRELAEIDAFIADQQKLHDLSIEYHFSQVHQLVTKGTRKNIVLTDSEFDWIGSTPEHWSLQKIGWLFKDIGSGTTPSSADKEAFVDGTINWVTTSELREAGVSRTRNRISQATLNNYSALKVHPIDSVLIAMYGATIGRLGWLEEPATVNQAVCALSNSKSVLPKYVFYVLMTARQHLLNQATGGGQPNINQETIRNLKIPVPPLDEQKEIIKALDEKTLALSKTHADQLELKELLTSKRDSILDTLT